MARIKRRRVIIIVSVVLGIVAGVVLFHFFFMDLDVFWAKLMRRLMMM
jgi:hypothetical protein